MTIDHQSRVPIGIMKSVIVMLMTWICTGCGAAGSPIAPENVGLEAKIREQERQRAHNNDAPSIEEEPVQLPPLRPVGAR